MRRRNKVSKEKQKPTQVPPQKHSPKAVLHPIIAPAYQPVPKPDKNAAVPKYVVLANERTMNE
jgi:hypothetical protein